MILKSIVGCLEHYFLSNNSKSILFSISVREDDDGVKGIFIAKPNEMEWQTKDPLRMMSNNILDLFYCIEGWFEVEQNTSEIQNESQNEKKIENRKHDEVK